MSVAIHERTPYTFLCRAYKDAYDGDTVYLEIDRGEGIFNKNKYRLWGCDTPEIRGASDDEEQYGREARAMTNNLLYANEESLLIHTHKKGKYDYSAELFVARTESGSLFNEGYTRLHEYLILRGHAVPYSGETKEPWETRKEIQDEARAKWLKAHPGSSLY